MNKILLGIGIIALALGVKMIYDARPIVKTYFSFGEENETTLRIKNNWSNSCHCWWLFILF